MNKDMQAQSTSEAVEREEKSPIGAGTVGEEETRLPWHRPAITRIAIRRTMNASGPANDTMARTP